MKIFAQLVVRYLKNPFYPFPRYLPSHMTSSTWSLILHCSPTRTHSHTHTLTLQSSQSHKLNTWDKTVHWRNISDMPRECVLYFLIFYLVVCLLGNLPRLRSVRLSPWVSQGLVLCTACSDAIGSFWNKKIFKDIIIPLEKIAIFCFAIWPHRLHGRHTSFPQGAIHCLTLKSSTFFG